MKTILTQAGILLAFMLTTALTVTAQEPIWEANTIILEKEKLGKGVFSVTAKITKEAPLEAPKPTSAGFVIGDKSVLVIEGMLNGDLAAQLIALVRTETDLPIRYLVNTSYHGDHSYGNYVFPAETAVIQHQGAKDYIAAYFDQDREFMMNYFGKGRGIEKAIPRTADLTLRDGDELTIDLGGKTVKIHTFGFGQTPGDLYIWQPDAKVMWVGNVLVAPKPAIPWLLDGRHREVLTTMYKIKDFLPDDATVVPGHYSPVGKEGLDFGIAYIETLRAQVQQAVKKGWTLDEARERIPMTEFRGYPIFDWLHYEVNLPKTYEEVKAEMSGTSSRGR